MKCTTELGQPNKQNCRNHWVGIHGITMKAASWYPAAALGLKSDLKIAADTVLSRPDDEGRCPGLSHLGPLALAVTILNCRHKSEI